MSVYIPTENELGRSALRWGYRKPDINLIHKLLDHIVEYAYKPKYILMSPHVWYEFRSNISDYCSIEQSTTFEDERVAECCGLPIYVDKRVRGNIVTIICKNYFCVSSYISFGGSYNRE